MSEYVPGGSFLGGNFTRKNSPGGSLMGGDFPVGNLAGGGFS